MASQVLYVRAREGEPQLMIYVRFLEDAGSIKAITLQVPKMTKAPWICIQKKEYVRLCTMYQLASKPRRIPLSPEERMQHKRNSGQLYRTRIAKRRETEGTPLTAVHPGHRAPTEDVQRVQELLKEGTLKGVEIALIVGRSTSFVSRVRNGQRRYDG